jgi:hypothetical protein
LTDPPAKDNPNLRRADIPVRSKIRSGAMHLKAVHTTYR